MIGIINNPAYLKTLSYAQLNNELNVAECHNESDYMEDIRFELIRRQTALRKKNIVLSRNNVRVQ